MRTVVAVCGILTIGALAILYYFGGFDLVYAQNNVNQEPDHLFVDSNSLNYDSKKSDYSEIKNKKIKPKSFPKVSYIAPPSQTDSWKGQPPTKDGKAIQIILSVQRLLAWEDGELLGNFLASTGKAKTPTKQGEFEVLTKLKMAYGSGDGDTWAMPYWLGIYMAGSTENGIHGLPYINGYKESAASLGTPVSHGCIRIADQNQKWLYGWAELGTPVYVEWTAEGQY